MSIALQQILFREAKRKFVTFQVMTLLSVKFLLAFL